MDKEINTEPEKLDHEVLFRVSKEMFEKMPSGRNRSAYCRKCVEIMQNLEKNPNLKKVLEMLGYDSLNIYERVVIIPREVKTDSPVNSKELDDLKTNFDLLMQYAIILTKLFIGIGQMFTLEQDGDWFLPMSNWNDLTTNKIDNNFLTNVVNKFEKLKLLMGNGGNQ